MSTRHTKYSTFRLDFSEKRIPLISFNQTFLSKRKVWKKKLEAKFGLKNQDTVSLWRR